MNRLRECEAFFSSVSHRFKHSITPFVLAVVVSLPFGLSFHSTTNANLLIENLTAVDRDLPEFSLKGVDGSTITPESLKGKTWLINFWAVWCPPCLEELPALNNAWSQLEPHNVGMLAINIGEEAPQIEAFLAKHNLSIDFPIVIGDKYKSLGNWGGVNLPYTVVVNAQGRVVYEAAGDREWDQPEFIDAVLAVNNNVQAAENATPQSRIAAGLAWFHGSPLWQKVIIVVLLIALAIALILLIRRLSKRKTIAQ